MSEPIIDMREGVYYLGIWFLGGEGRDWMCVVWREPTEDFFRLKYRMRYYADPDEEDGFNPFDSRDEKSVWTAVCPPEHTEDQVIKVIDELVDGLIKMKFCGTTASWEVRKRRHKNLIRGDHKKFEHVLVGLPYTHIRKPTPEEIEQIKARAKERS